MLDHDERPSYRQLKRRPPSRSEPWLFPIGMIAGTALWWSIAVRRQLLAFFDRGFMTSAFTRSTRFRLGLLTLVVVAIAVSTALEAASGCGSRGGPGYRGPNGRCVGWDELGRICGTPPTTRCSSESVAVGAPEHAAGQEKLRGELRKQRETDGQPAIRNLARS